MSRNVIYKCNNCGKTVCDKEPKWLEIGAESENKLYMKNEISDYGITKLSSYQPCNIFARNFVL